MFPTSSWDSAPILGGAIAFVVGPPLVFGRFARLARSLIILILRPAAKKTGKKGDQQMSSQSQFTRTLVALAAALVMSTVAVSAAVGPAQATAAPAKVSINA
jgi:hypothetical protein